MTLIKLITLTLGAAGLGLGLYAAYLWKEASRVTVVPTFVHYDGIASVDPSIAHDEWIVGIIDYANESGKLNSSASKWTAAAVFCSSMSGFIGLFS
jgi:hypothetical protein